jgi:hypothetical protein
MFAPAVLARAKRECNQYLIVHEGQLGNTAMLRIARLLKGKPDPERTYEVHAELQMRDDVGPKFVPVRCTCDDANGRKRLCKHSCIVCMWLDIPVTAGQVLDDNAAIAA